jgi:hypothetical protein
MVMESLGHRLAIQSLARSSVNELLGHRLERRLAMLSDCWLARQLD